MLLAVLASLWLIPAAAHAQFDENKTPAEPVPSDRWGDLEPRAIIGDSTWFNFKSVPNENHPFWFALDEENGFLFTAAGKSVEVYDARTNPGSPQKVGSAYGPRTAPEWFQSDLKFYLFDIDAPPGVDSVAVTVGAGQGILVWDFSDKANPSVHYQDYQQFKDANQVWVTTLGGVHYAFVAANELKAVLVYNLSKAQKYSGCDSAGGSCSDVFTARIPIDAPSVSYLDGAGPFLAVGKGNQGVEILNVSNPQNSSQVLNGSTGGRVHGVALWEQGGKYYLGVADSKDYGNKSFFGWIYDVSCITTGTCAADKPLSKPLAKISTNGFPLTLVTFSRESGVRPVLYIGGGGQGDVDTSSGGVQREFLLDVTNPGSPVDLTPVHPEGYWGWYYFGNDTGFNWIGPRVGKFHGSHFYRAAYGILDAHELVGASPPVANFTFASTESDGKIYPGSGVNFTDLSSGAPTEWFWTFDGGSPSQSTEQHPQGVTFSTVGDHEVELVASNEVGSSDPVTKVVQVLDPAPQVGSISISPADPLVCQQITFTANNVTGQPPLSLAWEIRDASDTLVLEGGNVNPFTWQTDANTPAGDYTVQVTATNDSGIASAQASFTLEDPPPLGFSAPIEATVNFGKVTFKANSVGASEWIWDFGDGRCPSSGFTVLTDGRCRTTDPVLGESPTHQYQEVGTYTVSVEIRNCKEGPLEQSTTVEITSIVELHAEFELLTFLFCTGDSPKICFATVGQELTFQDLSTGAESWAWDWDGNGTFEDPDPPDSDGLKTHTYNTTGEFQPVLRVQRGAETDTFQLPIVIKVESSSSGGGTSGGDGGGDGGGGGGGGSSPPPSSSTLKASFTFSPTSPEAGQPVNFDGSSSTGSPTSYVWDFGDGTPFATGQKVTHTFAKAGSYKVKLTVSKSGTGSGCSFGICSSETTKQVTVSGPAGLLPSFETSATCTEEFGIRICEALTGQDVTFKDTTDKATSRTWDFGDGTTSTEVEVTHSWDLPGTFELVLTVSDGETTASISRTFVIDGDPVAGTNAVMVPWIAQTKGVLDQTSDLYLYNPDTQPATYRITFLKRGLPEEDPPSMTKELPAGATLYIPDILLELGLESLSGFLKIEVVDSPLLPVVVSFNTTFRKEDGAQFGQMVPGIAVRDLLAAKTQGKDLQHLIGLQDNLDRMSVFGVTNPNDEAAFVKIRLYDRFGELLSTLDELGVPPFGQKQFQIKEIREVFGISDIDDYRVEIETDSDQPRIFPYAVDLRRESADPSFIRAGDPFQQKVYLVGVLNAPGLNESSWQTDVVLFNPTQVVIVVDITFMPLGPFSEPEGTVTLNLQAGETVRLVNVLVDLWGLDQILGVLIFESDSPVGLYPVIQGESYDAARPTPASRFGQFMSALSDNDAAEPGERQVLVGLGQDEERRTTLWLFNPSEERGAYQLTYSALDGTVLGTLDYAVPEGRIRQLSPSQHPIPAEGVKDGFTVEIEVLSGKLLSAAQVVNQLNDPAYITGAVR